MRIDMAIPSLSLAAGGPTRTVVQLCDSLARKTGVGVRLISQKDTAERVSLPEGETIDVCIGESARQLNLKLGQPGRQALHRAFARYHPQILHNNGIWHPMNHWATRVADRHGIPIVIQPRGMLEPWALGWHAGKKRCALALYQQRDLASATLLVATAEQEAENLRRFGLRQPIAVIPNGVDRKAGKGPSDRQCSSNQSKCRALFLSRVHPKKGLLILLRAWAAAQPTSWILSIAGPDEDGHLSEVVALAETLGIREQVEYLGEFDDQAKWDIYRSADLFVLPTFSENFGVVVAEALSQGVPVITTTGTPWKDLATHGCGWWVEPMEAELRAALTEAFMLPPGRLVEMGERGRDYAQRYDWSVIAEEMMDAYQWVLGQGPLPETVVLD